MEDTTHPAPNRIPEVSVMLPLPEEGADIIARGRHGKHERHKLHADGAERAPDAPEEDHLHHHSSHRENDQLCSHFRKWTSGTS